MKKVYNFLTALLVAVCCFGFGSLSAQVYFSEDFSQITESGDCSNCQCESAQYGWGDDDFAGSYLGAAGWSQFKLFPANGKLRFGTGSAQGWLQTPAIDCSANNGEFRVRFDAKAWNSANESTKLYICVNGEVADSVENLPKTNAADVTSCDMQSYTVYLTGGTANTQIKFMAAKANNSRFFIDNIVVESAEAPDMNVSGTMTILTSTNTPATTTLHVVGHNLDAIGTTTISINGDGFTTDVTSLENIELMNGVGADVNVTFQSATPGDFAGVLTLSNADITTTVNLSASCFAYTEVATIADLRSKIDWSDITANMVDSVIYKYTGEAIVVAADSYNGQKVLQDATGAIYIFDKFENITTPLAIGDKVTGISGTLTNYYGFLEFCPVNNIDRKISSYNDVEALSITLDQLNDINFMNAHQSELVMLEGVSFVSTGTFATGNNAERLSISQNNVTDSAIYTYFRNDVDYLGSTIPAGYLNIVGINYFSAVKMDPSCAGNTCARYPARYYVVPRSSFDFERLDSYPSTVAENEVTINVYPNPTNGIVTVELSENATNIFVYDVFGKLVNSQSAHIGVNVVNVEELSTGVYFLRIFNENSMVGTAKVVRK